MRSSAHDVYSVNVSSVRSINEHNTKFRPVPLPHEVWGEISFAEPRAGNVMIVSVMCTYWANLLEVPQHFLVLLALGPCIACPSRWEETLDSNFSFRIPCEEGEQGFANNRILCTRCYTTEDTYEIGGVNQNADVIRHPNTKLSLSSRHRSANLSVT